MRRGGLGAVFAPLVVLAGYAIYRENRKDPPPTGDGPDSPQ